ncbi:hypothetical protein [Cohnella sp. OV330]|uniref:hypothetical protein n=1 Tax=Cohnella sp. OV330 TaxID=1855288 RepID=UPI000D7CEA8D|nr:hypothetical protein [Cohnella sp. OV330]
MHEKVFSQPIEKEASIMKILSYTTALGFLVFFFLIPVLQGDVSIFRYTVGILGFAFFICITVFVNKYLIERFKDRLKIKFREEKNKLLLVVMLCNLASLLMILGGFLLLEWYTKKQINFNQLIIVIVSIFALLIQSFSEVKQDRIERRRT